MKRRRSLLVLPLILVATAPGLTACQVTSCPAIGFVNASPIELRFAQEPISVKACFGQDCAPAPVTRDGDGRWLVPQDKAHHLRLGESPPVGTPSPGGFPGYAGATSIRVIAVLDGRTLDEVHEIPRQKRHPENQCSPEYDYLPVRIG